MRRPAGFLRPRRVAQLVAGLLALSVLTACALFLTPPPPPTVLVPTPAIHDYGQVYVGTTAESPAVRWRNVSGGDVEVIGVLPFPGAFEPTFAVVNFSPAVPFQSFTIAPGQSSFPFFFVFKPKEKGIVYDVGYLVPTVGSVSQVLQLVGEGVIQISNGDLTVGGRDLVADQVLDFGTVALPRNERLKEFRLTNSSSVPITINARFVRRAPYNLVSPTPPFVLPAGGSLVIAIVFRPTAPGEFPGGITFTDVNNPGNAAGTALIGRAE